jgi:cell wall-associated NlpC family hydrolase
MKIGKRTIGAVALAVTLLAAPTSALPGVAAADSNSGQVTRQQALNTVIARGLSQRGVPYLYGGGDAAGPTRGTGPNADIVGFDASGLMVYSFAGAGIKLPRTSAEQYKVGRKVAPAQARPGDLIFFGPGGSQSVAMYLGNGQMLEATDPVVTVSSVRTASMAPYLTRIIDY